MAQLKSRLFWRMKRDEDRRKFNHALNDRVFRKREEVRRDHKQQVRAIKIDCKKEDRLRLPP